MKPNTILYNLRYIKFIFLLWILIIPTKIHSQQARELLQSLKTLPNDTTRIKPLIQLADYYSMVNQDSTIFYLRKAILLEKEQPNPLFLYKLQSRMGKVYSIKRILDSAQYYFNEAKIIAHNANLKNKEAGSLINLGIVYSQQRKYENALNQYYKAKVYFEKQGKYEAVSMILNNIGIILQDQGRFDEAISYHKKNLLLLQKNDLNPRFAATYSNIASNFLNLKKSDSTLYYAKLATTDFKKNKDNYGLALIENITGAAYRMDKKFQLSHEYYSKAILHYKKIDTNLSIKPLIDLASLLQKDLNDNNTAEEYFLEAKKYASNIDDKNSLDRIYYGLGIIYSSNKKYKLATEYFSKKIELHDSIYTLKRDQKVADVLAKYEIKEKEQKIKLLNEENKTKKEKLRVRNLVIISLFLLIISVLIIAYLLKQRAVRKLEKMESELQKYLLQIKDLNSKITISSNDFSEKYELTERETEILNLLNKGMSYSVIGETIFISKNTVKYHLKNIYIKLDVKNRIEALNKMKS